jgi:hypothetical protein
MAAPIFRKSGYSDLTLSKLIYGLDRPQTKVQVKERTAGGELQVEDLGVTIRERVLPMSKLTDTEVADFRTWHDTVLDGAVETFTFIDEDGTSHTARWVDDTFRAPRTSYNRNNPDAITLEIVSTP